MVCIYTSDIGKKQKTNNNKDKQQQWKNIPKTQRNITNVDDGWDDDDNDNDECDDGVDGNDESNK